jgi:hypothetical protein
VYYDPRVDKHIEEVILHGKFMQEVSETFRPYVKSKLGDDAVDKKDDLAALDDQATGQREHPLQILLTPKPNQPELNPAERQEMLVKISSYEGALQRCLTRIIRVLDRVQSAHNSCEDVSRKKSRGRCRPAA